MLGQMGAPGSTAPAVAAASRHDDPVLLAEVEETDAAYLLELLPDVQKEGVDLMISGRCLTVTGWMVEGGGTAGIDARRAFRYEVLLPYDVDTGSVSGSFRGGALRVRAGKLRASRPRRLRLL
jgi:HSP20 family molecular chaperone IbpA